MRLQAPACVPSPSAGVDRPAGLSRVPQEQGTVRSLPADGVQVEVPPGVVEHPTAVTATKPAITQTNAGTETTNPLPNTAHITKAGPTTPLTVKPVRQTDSRRGKTRAPLPRERNNT